jgi:hypothetical protein
VTSKLNLGAVLKTPFTADIKQKSSISWSLKSPDDPGDDQSSSSRSTEHKDLDMPMSYGIGLAYRSSDNLTASLDLYRTEWDNFELKDSEGNPDDFYGFSLRSGIASGRFIFDIAYQYRFGNNVGKSILQKFDFSQDVKEHTLYSSIIIHF